MLLQNKFQYIALAVFSLLFFGFVGFTVYPQGILASEIVACDEKSPNETEKIDCWQDIMRGAFDVDGTQAAFDVFEVVYKNYEVFANTGCHRHAHRIGDMSYYFDYLTHKDFTKMDFPKGATACGYGFYHGFFEHLVQDNTSVEFVTQMCEYMRNNLGDVAPAISQTCYHGSGHGFLLARADELTQESQWSVEAFTQKPLEQCESLPQASDTEIAECRQGVYNVIVDWMADGEYGLSYNTVEPFAMCDREPYERQFDCYYEIAQKIDGLSNGDPLKMVAIVEKAKRVDLQTIAMSVGVAGVVQQNPQNDQITLLSACQSIDRMELKNQCILGIIGGLVEHTIPGTDYKNAINFCESDQLTVDERPLCDRELLGKLKRFRTDIELEEMCSSRVLSTTFCKNMEKNSETLSR
ncbi:MAG: hypothetical protein JKX80_02915 [Candidatus Pacebacteria bacterium]|nr:hypothetical protein [Candidatus Paceibacterota bacterium]